MQVEIRIANPGDVDRILPLLDGYREFYGKRPEPMRAREFLEARLALKESVIFLAEDASGAIGFTQLFPSFSTVSLAPIYILNDLYVLPDGRGKGIGRALLQKAQVYCAERGFKGLALETAVDNPAQKLYEALGWKKDTHCFHYFWSSPVGGGA